MVLKVDDREVMVMNQSVTVGRIVAGKPMDRECGVG